MKKGKILVVDDNKGIRDTLKILLAGSFEQIEILSSPVTIIRTIESSRPDVVLLDMNFSAETNTGNEGLFWLSEIKSRWPDIPVVLFTAYADISLAVEGMKRGAADFIVKPWNNAKLIETLTGVRDRSAGSNRRTASTGTDTPMFYGNSPEMQTLKHNVERIASTEVTVQPKAKAPRL